MAGDDAGLARLTPPAPDWNRFAGWPPLAARLLLGAVAVLLVAAALVPISAGRSTIRTAGIGDLVAGAPLPDRKRDDDLALYDRAIERIRGGENYYDFIVAEHRAAQYPVRPGIAVRLPTLAVIEAALPLPAQIALSVLLMLATLVAWWRRLGDEGCPPRLQRLAVAMLFLGVSLGTNRHFFVLHELWAGMLLTLAFGLHRPGRKWGAALIVAGLALAIREHVLPFVLLLAACAAWRRDWREAAAWTGLALAFLAGLAWHLSIIDAQVLPTDREGQGWLTVRGLSGWLSNVVLSSNLRFLPHWLAGPAVILMVLGWAAWKSPAGSFGTLLFLGYGLAFMIAGRGDNYYWGAVIAPPMFLGLAFVPAALAGLRHAASRKVIA